MHIKYMHQFIMLLLGNNDLGRIFDIYNKYTVYRYYIRFWAIQGGLTEFLKFQFLCLSDSQTRQQFLFTYFYQVPPAKAGKTR